LQCALIVEGNGALREAMAVTVRQLGAEVLEATTSAEAIARLKERAPDLVIADVCLPDGSAHALFDATRRLAPEPLKIAISGKASPEQAFELSNVGVRAYLAKPFSLKELRDAIARVRTELPPHEAVVRGSVGYRPLRELTSLVRKSMTDEALARSRSIPAGISKLGRFVEGCWHSWYAFVHGLRENGLVEPDVADEDLLAALETARREHANLPERLQLFNSVSERVRFFLSPYLSEKGRQWSVGFPDGRI
jgi:CheY-like chemotaxis protein